MTIENFKVSPHFSYRELACRCCGSYTADPKLLLCLEWIRHDLSDALGADTPLLINSSYRCPQHNAAVGGAPSSLHLMGLAADIRKPVGIDWRSLYDRLSSVPLVGGIGLYPQKNFFHVDVRGRKPTGERSLWCVNSSGMGPIERAWK